MSQAIPLAMPDTREWMNARRMGIGASEAAAACGLSKYKTPLEIYHLKRGNIPEFTGNDATRLGKKLEPIVVSEFCERENVGLHMYPVPMLRHPDHPFMLATPDALLETGEPLECKTSTWRINAELGPADTDEVPAEWLCQCQQQLAVLGARMCHLAVLLDGRTLRTFRVVRDDDLIAVICAAEGELWDRILRGDPPDPDWSHDSTPELVGMLTAKVDEGVEVQLSQGGATLWGEYEQLGRQIADLESRRRSIRAQVLVEIGEAGAAVLPDGEHVIRRRQVAEAQIAFTKKAFVDIRKVKRRL